MTPYLIAGAAVISAAAGFYGGWTIKQGQWDAATVAAQTEREAALTTIAESIQKIESESDKPAQSVRAEIRNQTVYKECEHSPEAVKSLNSLIVGGQEDRSHDAEGVTD
jgi:ribonuclease D